MADLKRTIKRVLEPVLSDDSRRRAFQSQDVVIASVPVPQVAEQRRYLDIAISCGLVRFVPSEFDMDMVKPEAVQWRPRLGEKGRILDHLESQEDRLTCTAFMTGGFFDWGLLLPGGFRWNFPKGEVAIHRG